MKSKKEQQLLTRSVAITANAYETLSRASQVTGLPLGKLAALAIDRTFDETALRDAQTAARRNIIA